ncbi:MAG: ABC transporter substrate-binding protein [Mesorhizobium sp.]|uniref:ABC transporter substrate-binding protein n=1 Tax=unclassified Mesorhizobium TaxID=325217 RepID=UPI000F763E44|nr:MULTISPECIES: ABC transporter substrate-binding protein [unclassified Mesorhizobium]AZN98034.1 ABC transporter substrate-binding protein [Mesorhizobium sp. M9A.F.Ca.ET.002.03.1.2]AZO19546.1 ABC transporter substrate-binding protein [Mesorhizobium sp. M1E.F.Ca.ET.045.02.1.1]RWJ38170.1 MAG: ABC transporter substrate-binding protein [Mesorhizobium sp.]RWJ78550.1 MAG: ABC transporter substrate-binding protein [Mesorhizobium sp.]TGQ30007.1 ABC transporter substrate-binding protein [Mesorhizobium
MTISRRNLFKVGVAAGAALSIPSVLRAQTSPAPDRTVRMVIGLGVFDPVVSTSDTTFTHAFAIYDTLFGVDSTFAPHPQMVGKWRVSDDRKTYTFELRDGLGWHDGTLVTAADCVASIHRWGEVAPGGQLLIARARDISKKDDKTFTIALKEPMGALLSILAFQGPFIMREKDANLPPTEQVTANIGSGPFKFNHTLAKPGASFTYDRNEKYVPRTEAPDGLAGGKIVKVDRVIWDNIADQQTALAALQAGEVDFLSLPPVDLLPVIESDPNLELQVLDKTGQDMFLSMNCLQKPFDNVKVRQAMLHLVDQEAVMRAAFGDPKYFRTVTSIFGNETPMSNDENTGWFKKGGDPEKAKQLLKEAGYAGEKVVILETTDWREADNAAQFLAVELRKIGVNAELAPSDWSAATARLDNKGPVEDGGWSIFITSEPEAIRGNVITAVTLTMNGEKGWVGWPQNDEYEALRAKWADVETLEERKAIARKMQRIFWDYASQVPLGQQITPIARRKTLTGLIGVPAWIPMWNMQKA